uniref:Ribosomal protein S10 n=1 Tax=Toxarium undulatum TaxID=210620 RepID=A0A2U9GIK9_9STRA|nr:ribosomal protein S10 [Toxarium undulatum]AWQ64113.1 ribosomal protein S10 [Toxarium undulatum]
MFLYISICSKTQPAITRFCYHFFKIMSNKTLKLSLSAKIIPQKKRRTLFSLLKSPHVNKTAQNQFCYIQYKKKIVLCTPKPFNTMVLLKKLQRLIAGVKIIIQIQLNKRKFYDTLTVRLNPNQVCLSSRKKIDIFKYLKLLDYYGELSFNAHKLNKSLGSSVG